MQPRGWTSDVDTFLQWLSGLSFTSAGGYDEAALAKGLSSALTVLASVLELFSYYVFMFLEKHLKTLRFHFSEKTIFGKSKNIYFEKSFRKKFSEQVFFVY